MRRHILHARLILATAGLVVAVSAAVPHVWADQTFHTVRLALQPVNGAPPLRQGFVVDVHANGPQIAAQERYILVGAAPNTTYHVQLNAYPDTACAQMPVATIPESTLTTNAAGNGEAGFTFPAAQSPPPGSYNLQWHVLDSSGTTVLYQTACTAVAVD